MTPRDREYEALRREIEKYSEFEHSLYKVLYVSVTAILAWGISSTNALICLLAYCIIFPSFRVMLSYNSGILRIGAYMHVFYDEYFWEKRLRRVCNLPKSKVAYYSSSYKTPFIFVSVLSTILSLIILYENPVPQYSYNIIITLLSLLLLTILVIYAFKQGNGNTIKDKYIKEFEEIKEEEKKSISARTSQNGNLTNLDTPTD